jgi:hypothetical protein
VRNKKIQVGDRSGKRVVLGIDPSGSSRHMRVKVRCDCGDESVIGVHVFRATIGCKSCSPGGAKRMYGNRIMKPLKLYHTWIAMRRRCDLGGDLRNARWGGRGIVVCREWDESFVVFEKWALANGYEPGLSIDRINPDGNYEPSNCEFVTRSENSKRCRATYELTRRQSSDGWSSGLLAFGG